MIRFAAALRWVLTAVFVPVLVIVLSDVGKDFLSEIPIGSIGNLSWFYAAALVLTGLTIGARLDWLVRRFDGERDAERVNLGRDFLTLARGVEEAQKSDPSNWPRNIKRLYPELHASFYAASTQGIWHPATACLSQGMWRTSWRFI